MVRVSRRYFDVLAAEDTLTAAEATLRGRQPPARAGREALRGRPDRDHRRAGGAGRARQRDGRRHRGQARARERPGIAARTDRRGVPALAKPADDMPLDQPQPANEDDVGDQGDGAEPRRDRGATRRRHRQGQRQDRAVRPPADASTSTRSATDELGRPDAHLQLTTVRACRTRSRRPDDPRTSNRNDDVIGVRVNVPIFSGGVTQSQRAPAGVPASRLAREARGRAARRRARDARRLPRRDRRAARVQALKQAVRRTRPRSRRPRPASRSARARRWTCSTRAAACSRRSATTRAAATTT